MSDSAWCQATLSFRLDGLGLCDSENTTVPAYLGCCNDVAYFLTLSSVVNHLYVLHGLVGQITHLPNMLFKYHMTMNSTSLFFPILSFVMEPAC